jgi:aminoglycoside phosphotransferase (APT) family kinase protein
MEPGRLLASGRDSDIFEFGRGTVLRRARNARSIEHEARVMEYVATFGFPVPVVRDVRAEGTEIVMDRVDGKLMLNALLARPWNLARFASMLADLHDQLHTITAPDWLHEAPAAGGRVLHLDLHPQNVIMSSRGPMVIDWSNAARGDARADVALTYVLLTGPRMPGPRPVRVLAQPARVVLARCFLRRYGTPLRPWIALAAREKTRDPNMFPDEVRNLDRLARRYSAVFRP